MAAEVDSSSEETVIEAEEVFDRWKNFPHELKQLVIGFACEEWGSSPIILRHVSKGVRSLIPKFPPLPSSKNFLAIEVRKLSTNTTEWAIKHGCTLHSKAARQAAIKGDLAMLEYLVSRGCKVNFKTMAAAARRGLIYILEYLHPMMDQETAEGYAYNRVSSEAASGSQFETLKWLFAHGYAMEAETARKAAQHRRFDIVKWLLESRRTIDSGTTAEFAYQGNLEALEYLIANDISTETSWAAAAEGGQLNVLKYCKEHGYFQDAKQSAAVYCAARRNQVAMLDWLLDEGFEMDFDGLEEAAEQGHLQVMHWAKARAFSFTETMLSRAIRGGSVEVAQFLVDEGQVIPGEAEYEAGQNGSLKMFEWLDKKGAPLGENSLLLTAQNGHLAALRYLAERESKRETKLEESVLKSISQTCVIHQRLESARILHQYGLFRLTPEMVTKAEGRVDIHFIRWLRKTLAENPAMQRSESEAPSTDGLVAD